MTLCDKTDNDIRACLSTLQFFKSKGKELRAADVQHVSVGQKDSKKSLFSVWREIFEIPRGTKKTFKLINGKSVAAEEDCSSVNARYRNILHTVQSCGEFEKVMNGVFENYLEVKFKDSQLNQVSQISIFFL